MEKSKIINWLLLFAIAILITVPTIIKVESKRTENEYLVVSNDIIEKANRCYYDKKCLENKITLKELIEYKYIEKIVNPKTEEYFSDESYVLIASDNDSSSFYEVK